MGAGPQYPFPKEVWAPSGGWWSRPSNWRSNTAICFALIGGLCYATWNFSASREIRHIAPIREIPSQRWSAQAKEIGVRQE